MKHFLGGAAVGMMFGIARSRIDHNDPAPFFAAVVMSAVLFGVAAWGLLP